MACYYETRVTPIINCLLLQFGVDSICGQKNALHIKFVFSDSSLEENFIKEEVIRGVIVHSRLCIREQVATTVPKISVVNKDKTL